MTLVSVWLLALMPNETQNHLLSSRFREVVSKTTHSLRRAHCCESPKELWRELKPNSTVNYAFNTQINSGS